jgi:DNA polymerase III delta prime subunit
MTTIPWVEKYRPQEFERIILSDTNKKILTQIIKTGHFPNILFYGPPGTGKTTTIMNLIKEYQNAHETISPEKIIHLNASDERGIETIRSQINDFINSNHLFTTGNKFVILDEVDYMTATAQQCLKNMITSPAINTSQTHLENVRYCLICNYVSRLDFSLQKEFLKLRFNMMPTNDIIKFLHNICREENLTHCITKPDLMAIQQYYQNDIRSMINYIQSQSVFLVNSNKPLSKTNLKIIQASIWKECIKYITTKTEAEFVDYIQNISIQYNTSWNEIIISFLYYFMASYTCGMSHISIIKDIIHSNYIPNHIRMKRIYFFIRRTLK